MNLKKKISSAVIFLVASIIFVSATPLANNVFAQTEGEEDSSTTNYENFQNCLSNASGMYNVPSGDQIVNCFAESGYVQGSSSTSNAADTENESENTQVSVAGDVSQDDKTENVQVKVADSNSLLSNKSESFIDLNVFKSGKSGKSGNVSEAIDGTKFLSSYAPVSILSNTWIVIVMMQSG